jgi:hypothetical protein
VAESSKLPEFIEWRDGPGRIVCLQCDPSFLQKMQDYFDLPFVTFYEPDLDKITACAYLAREPHYRTKKLKLVGETK